MHAGRRAEASSTCRQTAFSGATQYSHNCQRFSLGVCSCSFFKSQLTLIPRFRVTEHPYKIPFYAALLYYLSIPTSNEDAGANEENTAKLPLGRLILDDFWKGFQAYLDKLAWRETHLCMRFHYFILPAPRPLTLLQTDLFFRAPNRREPHIDSKRAKAHQYRSHFFSRSSPALTCPHYPSSPGASIMRHNSRSIIRSCSPA